MRCTCLRRTAMRLTKWCATDSSRHAGFRGRFAGLGVLYLALSKERITTFKLNGHVAIAKMVGEYDEAYFATAHLISFLFGAIRSLPRTILLPPVRRSHWFSM